MPVTISLTLAEALAERRDHLNASLKSARDSYKRDIKAMRRNAKIIAGLSLVLPEGSTMTVGSVYNFECPTVSVEREKLPALRRAIGPLHVTGKYLRNADEEQPSLHITLRADAYPDVEFSYNRPFVEGLRCKIVEQVSTNRYKSLVCEME